MYCQLGVSFIKISCIPRIACILVMNLTNQFLHQYHKKEILIKSYYSGSVKRASPNFIYGFMSTVLPLNSIETSSAAPKNTLIGDLPFIT